MAHSVTWLEEAIEDVDRIASYIAADSPAYASALVQRFIDSARSLSDYPSRGRMVPEWNDESIRECIVGNYRLIYQVHDRDVVVLTVIHGARLLPESLRSRRQ